MERPTGTAALSCSTAAALSTQGSVDSADTSASSAPTPTGMPGTKLAARASMPALSAALLAAGEVLLLLLGPLPREQEVSGRMPFLSMTVPSGVTYLCGVLGVCVRCVDRVVCVGGEWEWWWERGCITCAQDKRDTDREKGAKREREGGACCARTRQQPVSQRSTEVHPGLPQDWTLRKPLELGEGSLRTTGSGGWGCLNLRATELRRFRQPPPRLHPAQPRYTHTLSTPMHTLTCPHTPVGNNKQRKGARVCVCLSTLHTHMSVCHTNTHISKRPFPVSQTQSNHPPTPHSHCDSHKQRRVGLTPCRALFHAHSSHTSHPVHTHLTPTHIATVTNRAEPSLSSYTL